MRHLSDEAGYLLVDCPRGARVVWFRPSRDLSIYGPTFALSQRINNRLSAQQDVRLALDRVAQALHETSPAYGRLRVYPPEAGCAQAYEACVGFISARDDSCAGTFQVIDGRANWQATLYLWRDTASNELRLRYDTTTTFPVTRWPSLILDGFRVIGRHVVAVSVTLDPAGAARPTLIAILLQEQAPAAPSDPANFFTQTIFLPQNR